MTAAAATVVLASAGTGKTYQLALAFARLLARGVPPESILASTFTRKAAGEILDRVLGRLAKAATSPQACVELSRELGADHDQAFYADLLARLARRVDRFQVTTLDAWFVRLARAFQPELGLPPDWQIADELTDARLKAEALGRLVAESDPRAFVELLRDLQKVDASRSVLRAALDAIALAAAAFAESDPAAWSWIEPPEPPSEGELEQAVAAIEACECPRTQKGTERKNWRNGLDQLQAGLAAEDWARLGSLTLVARVLSGEGRFDKVDIPDELAAAIAVVLGRVAHELARDLDRQNRATFRMVEGFEARYGEVQRAARLLRFDHLPPLLSGAGLAAGLGSRVDHLLLDEFQDTSPAQWRVLAPLASELARDASGTRSVFCVGDPKQSIYGWRKAEPRLLETLAVALRAGTRELDRSWRSAPVVIDAINQVFTRLTESTVFDRDRWVREVAARFQERFTRHEVVHEQLPGAVVLRTAGEGSRPTERWERCLDLAAERAAELHATAPLARIAILVRRNKGIPRLLYALKRRGVLASGEGGNPLVDAECVQVVLSLLQLADHPGDSAALFHVASSPLGPELGLHFDEPEGVRARARSLRRELAERGYDEVLSALRPAVERGWSSAWERRRFRQLVELAAVWGAEAGLRPSRFVERVLHEKVEDPSSARVRVMTVHRSKGLEFEAVILPELDRSWLQGRVDLYSRRRGGDPSAPYEQVSRSASETVRKLVRGLEALYVDTRKLFLTESLCTLYVAMTRAIHHLELIVAPRGAKKDAEGMPLSPAGLLRQLLGADAAEPAREIWRHEQSDDAWTAGYLLRGAPRPGEVEPQGPIPLERQRRPRELPRAAASRLAEPGEVVTAELLALASAARRRGLLVHRWLERVEWLETFESSDAELLTDARSLGVAEDAAREHLQRFRDLLASPGFVELLSRQASARRLGTSSGDLEVLRERSFLMLAGADASSRTLLQGAFDRAVVARGSGRAEVVDYKTDRVELGALAQRAEHHRPQLEVYLSALARITGMPELAITCRVAFAAVGVVVDLEATERRT